VQKNILEFPEDYTDDQKLDILFKLHRVEKYVKIDEQDKPMIVLALNQNDINSVEIDDEGGLVIGYSGDGWEKVNE
jgi:hypothetical protein